MSESEHEAEGSRAGEEHGDAIDDTTPQEKLLLLNSRRLMTAHLKQIAATNHWLKRSNKVTY